jgi:hypothetical protein
MTVLVDIEVLRRENAVTFVAGRAHVHNITKSKPW